MTLAIVAAFGLALIPLLSLLFEVAKRGIPGLSLEFFTESARGVDRRRRRRARDRRHAGDHRRRRR